MLYVIGNEQQRSLVPYLVVVGVETEHWETFLAPEGAPLAARKRLPQFA